MTPSCRFLWSALIVVGMGLSVSSVGIITIARGMSGELYNQMAASEASG
jgi:hypothetical protein